MKKLFFLEIGLFEIGFVILLLAIVFGILNYFQILSVSKVIPLLSFLPSKTNQPSAAISPTPPPVNSKENLLTFVQQELNPEFWPSANATQGAITTKDVVFLPWTTSNNSSGLVRFTLDSTHKSILLKRLSLQTNGSSVSAAIASSFLQDKSNHSWNCTDIGCTLFLSTATQKKSIRLFSNGSILNLSLCVVDQTSSLFAKFTTCP